MNKDIKCVICDEKARIAIEKFKGYQEGEDFSIYYCSSCNTSFVYPHVVDNKIYNYIYSQSDTVPGYHRYDIYSQEISGKKNPLNYLADKEAMYFAIKDILAQQTNKNLKILEVGSGLGYLTYAISKEGYDITGLDISSDAVKKAEQKFGNHFICKDIYQYALDNASKFDIVLLTEVIEHLPDPNGFCTTLISLLKNNGKLIITTPNKSAYSEEDYWDTESPPVHLTWFSEDSFKFISKKMGVSLSFFDFTNFNKRHINITPSKFYERFYKRTNRDYTLSREGKVLYPVLKAKSRIDKFKSGLKKFVKPLYEFIIIALLNNKNNLQRNCILCVILQKKV